MGGDEAIACGRNLDRACIHRHEKWSRGRVSWPPSQPQAFPVAGCWYGQCAAVACRVAVGAGLADRAAGYLLRRVLLYQEVGRITLSVLWLTDSQSCHAIGANLWETGKKRLPDRHGNGNQARVACCLLLHMPLPMPLISREKEEALFPFWEPFIIVLSDGLSMGRLLAPVCGQSSHEK